MKKLLVLIGGIALLALVGCNVATDDVVIEDEVKDPEYLTYQNASAGLQFQYPAVLEGNPVSVSSTHDVEGNWDVTLYADNSAIAHLSSTWIYQSVHAENMSDYLNDVFLKSSEDCSYSFSEEYFGRDVYTLGMNKSPYVDDLDQVCSVAINTNIFVYEEDPNRVLVMSGGQAPDFAEPARSVFLKSIKLSEDITSTYTNAEYGYTLELTDGYQAFDRGDDTMFFAPNVDVSPGGFSIRVLSNDLGTVYNDALVAAQENCVGAPYPSTECLPIPYSEDAQVIDGIEAKIITYGVEIGYEITSYYLEVNGYVLEIKVLESDENAKAMIEGMVF